MITRTRYLDRIRPFYNVDLIKVITGVRRCGKSVLLQQIAQDLVATGVPQDHILQLSLELYENRCYQDPDALNKLLTSFCAGTLTPSNENLSAATSPATPSDASTTSQHFSAPAGAAPAPAATPAPAAAAAQRYILLDEIQQVPNFEAVLGSIQAQGLASIFITGSNSKILSGELATLLGGRTLLFHVMPFSFSEYVEFAASVPGLPTNENALLTTYLNWGGFPLVAAQTQDATRAVVLENLYASIVLKDIVARNSIRSVSTLENIVDYLLASSGCVVSNANIAAALTVGDRKISSPTVYDYVHSICEAYVVALAKRYDVKGKKSLRAEPKAYACDPGLYRIRKSRVSDEYGHLIETVVYNELIARGYHVTVGKTKNGEIDFVVEHLGGLCYLQVCYLLASDAVITREFGAFDSIKDAHPKYVVSMDTAQPARNGVEHLNLADFLTGRAPLRFT